MRSPLNCIGLLVDEDENENSSIIKSCVEMLGYLVNDLLDLSLM